MVKLVSAEQMRNLERQADAAGLSFLTMMEYAGEGCARAIQQHLGDERGPVLVLVGPGNNGGDGLVAARYLHEWGYEVAVYIARRRQGDDPNLERARQVGLTIARVEQDQGLKQLATWADDCTVLVDALLGTGGSGEIQGDLRDILQVAGERLVTRRKPHREERALRPLNTLLPAPPEQRVPLVVAVDLPSGMNADTGAVDPLTLRADLTLTFGFPKRGLFVFPGAEAAGELVVADIGMDPSLAADITTSVATAEQVKQLLPSRPPNAHKGTFGKALIVAGSANYLGAPCLAAEGAYRVGAGLVTLALPTAAYRAIAGKVTEATYLLLPDDLSALLTGALNTLAERVGSYQAMLVGPGLGQESPSRELLQRLLRRAPLLRRRSLGFGEPQPEELLSITLPPLVLDADALNLLAGMERWWELLPSDTVLTPHPGEMARLLGSEVATVEADRLGVAQEAAQRWSCTVVLKGAYTVVASPQATTLIPFATPALATAGTGDVLAGAITGLRAQGLSGYDAAVCGAFVHAVAGLLGQEQVGLAGTMAGDLPPLLPRAISQVRLS